MIRVRALVRLEAIKDGQYLRPGGYFIEAGEEFDYPEGSDLELLIRIGALERIA
jgi:hypothetical protein